MRKMFPTRRTLTTLLVTGVGAAALLAGTATAADITPTATVTVTANTTGVALDANGYPEYTTDSRIRMDVTWAVPNGSRGGDTFLVALDNDLQGTSFLPMDLKDPQGNVVARTTYDGAGNIMFTLTNYVNGRTGVHGSAWFALSFNATSYPAVGDNIVEIYDATINIRRKPGTPPVYGWRTQKVGWWTTGNGTAGEGRLTALDENGALIKTDTPQFTWLAYVKNQVNNPAPSGHLTDWETVTITDSPRSGHHFDCTTTDGGVTYPKLNPELYPTRVNPLATLTIESCASDKLVATITKPRADHSGYGFMYQSGFTTNNLGQPIYVDTNGLTRVGFNPDGYRNGAEVNYEGAKYNTYFLVRRTAQGGDGTGVLPASVDIEKYSGAWNGPTGLDAKGQPTNLPAGDHDTAPGLKVTDGSATTITMWVTNTGRDILDDVVVTDDVFGAPVKNFTCTFGDSTAMPFQGLAPGKSFPCTATLPARFTGQHKDISTVTAIGRESRTNVADNDAFHAVPQTVPTTPTTPTTPTAPVTPPAPATTPAPVAVPAQATTSPAAKLAITKRALTPRVTAGRTAAWLLTVRNTSTTTATRVRVCGALPKGTTLASRNTTYTLAGRTAKTTVVFRNGTACITVPTLKARASVTWSLTTLVGASTHGTIRNNATAAASNANTVRASAKITITAPKVVKALIPAVTG